MEGLKDDYRKIVDIVNNKCPDYQLAVKCHPLDYMAGMPNAPGVIQKGQHYNNKPSWEELFPEEIFELAFETLVNPKIDWLEKV